MVYVLHILTHGRWYSEQYDSLEDATDAAIALEHEPRERADRITLDGETLVDRERLDALVREREA